MIEYVRATCGFAELGVAAQEYAFGGIPEEVPAGPTIVTFENIGEEAHEFVLFRINDDVTLTVEELFALPEEEVGSMVTEVGGTFALPGGTGYTVLELTPGRHVALCFVPQGTTIEVIEEMIAAEEAAAASSVPEGSALRRDRPRWTRIWGAHRPLPGQRRRTDPCPPRARCRRRVHPTSRWAWSRSSPSSDAPSPAARSEGRPGACRAAFAVRPTGGARARTDRRAIDVHDDAPP